MRNSISRLNRVIPILQFQCRKHEMNEVLLIVLGFALGPSFPLLLHPLFENRIQTLGSPLHFSRTSLLFTIREFSWVMVYVMGDMGTSTDSALRKFMWYMPSFSVGSNFSLIESITILILFEHFLPSLHISAHPWLLITWALRFHDVSFEFCCIFLMNVFFDESSSNHKQG